MATVRRHFPLLLRRCRLSPHESLPSLVMRLAQLNHYEPVTILRRLCLAGSEHDRLDCPPHGDIYEQLFELAWLDPYRLHDATGHYFAKILTPPGIQIECLPHPRGSMMPVLPPKIASEQLRLELAAQFCPQCLKKAQYHRVSWLPVAFSVCITHKRLLVDRCPDCQARISIRTIVEDCRCRRCGTELQTINSARVANDDFGLLAHRFIHGWLRVGRLPAKFDGDELLRQHPRLLFCLVDGIVDSIKALGSDWPYLHQPVTRSPLTPFGRIRGRLTPEQSYRLYATAFKTLCDWPQGFHEFLQAYIRRDGRHLKRGIAEDLGRLGTKWINGRWLHPAFSFVHDALAHQLVDTYVPFSTRRQNGLPVSSPPFISPIRAARLLGVSVKSIKRLVDAGFLIGFNAAYGSKPYQYGTIRQDTLLNLRLAWRKPISLEDAARWLGLTKSIVVDLVRVGLLTAQVKDSPWLFSQQTLDRCYSQVTTGVRSGTAYSTLPEVARTLSAVGLKVADILNLVAHGKLHCWAPTEAPALSKLSFDCYQIDTLLENPKPGKGLLSSDHAVDRLGVDSPTFSRWVIAGLFSPVVRYAYDTFFDPDEIDRFRVNYITSQEAAEMLGTDVVELEEWCWEWHLEPVRGTNIDGRKLCLFRRKDVKRVMKIEAR